MCLPVDSFQVLVREASRCLHRLHLPRSHDSGVGGKGPLLVRPSACCAEPSRPSSSSLCLLLSPKGDKCQKPRHIPHISCALIRRVSASPFSATWQEVWKPFALWAAVLNPKICLVHISSSLYHTSGHIMPSGEVFSCFYFINLSEPVTPSAASGSIFGLFKFKMTSYRREIIKYQKRETSL